MGLSRATISANHSDRHLQYVGSVLHFAACRVRKKRMFIDPKTLVPKLPKPRDLQPFPNTLSMCYSGHTGRVRSISPHPGKLPSPNKLGLLLTLHAVGFDTRPCVVKQCIMVCRVGLVQRTHGTCAQHITTPRWGLGLL